MILGTDEYVGEGWYKYDLFGDRVVISAEEFENPEHVLDEDEYECDA